MTQPVPALHRAVFRFREPPASELPASSPTARDASLARVEAVLFLASEPLTTRKIAQLAGLADGTLARTLIRRLNAFYDTDQQAFRAEEVAGGYQLLTRPEFGTWLRRLHQARAPFRLSPPALETLAVVAYRQPVLRAEIEAVRGVQCGEMLRQLMDKDLVRISGRADELGRPFEYSTTRRFLQLFGLRHLDELPRVEPLRPTSADEAPPHGEAQRPPPENTVDLPTSHPKREEPYVKTTSPAARSPEELSRLAADPSLALRPAPLRCAADEDDDWDDDEGIEEEDEDLEDEEEEEEEELEEDEDLEDEWEEVEDEDEDLEEEEDWEEEDEDDWDDEDEDEDDDWDDDEEDEED